MSLLPNILAVDDNRIQSYAIEKTLRARGFRVKSVHCGQDAIMEARDGGYDAILLDVNMPGLNGFQTCTMIRADSTIRQPAIVFHSTTDASEPVVRRAYDAGGDAFLTYPVDDSELTSVLMGTMASRRSQGIGPSNHALRPGDTVPESGIYYVQHTSEHMTSGEVILFEGVQLPCCTKCEVIYKLKKAVPHISEDLDFQQ